LSKRAEIRRRRHERRGRERTILLTLAGIVAAIVVIGIVASVMAANRQRAAEEGFTTTDSGLKYKITEEGDGPKPEIGDQVLVEYRGTLEDGTEFDSGEIPFTLGVDPIIPGWEEGIALLNEGSSAELIIPADLGYGAQGQGEIPPNATLYFDVTLKEVTPAE
jgi:FKBP-type peptidyl-prolyl cis-trans isomerase